MKVIQRFLQEEMKNRIYSLHQQDRNKDDGGLNRYMSKKDSSLPIIKQVDHANVDIDGTPVPKPIAKLGKDSVEAWIEKRGVKDKMTRQAN